MHPIPGASGRRPRRKFWIGFSMARRPTTSSGDKTETEARAGSNRSACPRSRHRQLPNNWRSGSGSANCWIQARTPTRGRKSSPGDKFLSSLQPLSDTTPNQAPTVNPVGASFAPLSSGIGRPAGLTPLPGIAGATNWQSSAASPAWAPQPPPWLVASTSAFHHTTAEILSAVSAPR